MTEWWSAILDYLVGESGQARAKVDFYWAARRCVQLGLNALGLKQDRNLFWGMKPNFQYGILHSSQLQVRDFFP